MKTHPDTPASESPLSLPESPARDSFPVGVIEGMYGAFWTMDDRRSFIPWLKSRGYDFYIYAPKGDACLRRLWFREFPPGYTEELADLAARARSRQLSFGIGFTPLNAVSMDPGTCPPELRTSGNAGAEHILNLVSARIGELRDKVNPDIVAVLFDDLRIDSREAGKLQNRILRRIIGELPDNVRIITCPSFYSLDPILEKIFGKMPESYFEDFARDLPERTDIFWTGDRVMSSGYSPESLERAREIIGRKPFIWDNYPVNDGQRTSGHLYLSPPENREALVRGARGAAVNPMKEHWLSRIPLSLIPKLLKPQAADAATPGQVCSGSSRELLRTALLRETSPEFADFILNRCPDFSVKDRDKLPEDLLKELASEAPDLPRTPGITADFRDFLKGRYIFDRTCLTG